MSNKLSAVVITFNEERNIERCLNSLQSVVDEIVVVDSYSTDCTKEICAKHAVRFIEHPFEGHIQQKNFAMRQAKHDWVLSLDADESLSIDLQISIKNAKEQFSADAYSFNRLNNYCGKWIHHSGWYPDRKIRLWNRNFGQWGGENPHDQVLLHSTSRTQHLKGDLLHYSYHQMEDHDIQLRKFAEISAQAKFQKGKNASIFMVYVSPVFKFLRNYIFKLGFLDGYFGLVICGKGAYENYLKYQRLRMLNKSKKRT